MAEFVNSAMIGENRLQACKTGEPVFYIRNSRRNLEIVVISQINLLLSNGASPGDIFVLGASVKGVNSNIRKMENALVERGIPCYVPTFDTERIDEKITEGKVVFSTFHSVKGRERKYVFVMGFDNSYFSIYASNLSTDICPNTLYVGCTRATQKLYLLEIDEYSTDRPLSFLKMTHHEMRDSVFVIFKGIPRSIFYEKVDDALAKESSKTGEKYHDVTPTDLVKFVPEQVIDSISPILDTVFIQECEPSAEREIHIPNTIETARGFYEDVCDLNGIAIPSIYYDHIYRVVLNRPDSNIGANILKQIIYDCLNDTREGEYLYLKSMMKEMPEMFSEVSDYLFLSNLFVAAKEKLLFKLKQIERTDYGWLSDSMVKECLDRLNQIIGDELSLEEPLVEYPIIQYDMEAEMERINQVLLPHFPEYDRKFRFSARTDLITEKCIWELKCTSSITIEHKLQVVLYDWLWRIVHSTEILSKKKRKNLKPRETRILNIKTGEIWFLNASFEELTTIVVALLKGKYDKPIAKTDEEFFIECNTYLSRFDKT
jgi:hypothetical protein